MTEEKDQYKYEFSSMKTDILTDKTKQEFEECHPDLWINTYPFKVELDTKDIDLHIYIDITNMSEYTDDDNRCIVAIGIIPSFDSLTEKYKERIISQFSDDDKEYMLQHKEQLLKDIQDYGLSVQLHSTIVEPVMLEHIIDSAMAVSPGIKGLIGFELDRMKNRIGNTGWDFLSNYCEGVDLLKLAMDKYREINK